MWQIHLIYILIFLNLFPSLPLSHISSLLPSPPPPVAPPLPSPPPRLHHPHLLLLLSQIAGSPNIPPSTSKNISLMNSNSTSDLSSAARGDAASGWGKGWPRPWPPKIEPFVPNRRDLNPTELKSWASRTGFNPNVSGETSNVISDRDTADLDKAGGRTPETEPILGRRRERREAEEEIRIGAQNPVLGSGQTPERSIEL